MSQTFFELMVALYAAAVGLVTAGLAVSLYQLVTDRTAGFVLFGRSVSLLFASFVFFAFCGPILVMRETSPRKGQRSSPGWLALRVAMVGMWSCCSGILILQVVLTLGQKLA